ncbi:hypothetical protein FGO68_gene10458 [Halteria grandinella]|uniref:Uncharacterized protein n=1 Tax=Halteria grandinella TaxID=5974 RepID=A0A8J8SXY8_HALGN|nr:hypothetical protein FGO68_gene10458 [Halteria grandinella]
MGIVVPSNSQFLQIPPTRMTPPLSPYKASQLHPSPLHPSKTNPLPLSPCHTFVKARGIHLAYLNISSVLLRSS